MLMLAKTNEVIQHLTLHLSHPATIFKLKIQLKKSTNIKKGMFHEEKCERSIG